MEEIDSVGRRDKEYRDECEEEERVKVCFLKYVRKRSRPTFLWENWHYLFVHKFLTSCLEKEICNAS